MNFGHFSTQNTSVKVEISNQVKCHTAQRSEARGGRTGPEAGRRRSRPSPATFVARAGAGGQSCGAGRGGAGGCAPLAGTPQLLPRRARPWRGLKAVPPAGPAAGPKRRPAASSDWTRGAARPRDPSLLAGQEGTGGPFLSSRSPPLLSVTRSPRSAPREAAAPRAARLCPGQRYS